MANEILIAMLRANGAGALAVSVVLVMRLPARRLFGAEFAYKLWLIPLAATLATFLPPRFAFGVTVSGSALEGISPANAAVLLCLWAVGAMASAVQLVHAQRSFLRAANAGLSGPAVVGVICPRIVMPPEDGGFASDERALIRAHEREHIRRRDPAAGAVMAIVRCFGWWNPLGLAAVHLARIDQECACDAGVMRQQRGARALYARTLLKSQLAAGSLPFGCRWPSTDRHPLETRVELLGRPSREASLVADIALLTLLAAAIGLAWLSKPPIQPIIRGYEPPPSPTHVSVLLIRSPDSVGIRSSAPRPVR